MKTYKIEFTKSAAKEFQKLPSKQQKLIARKIKVLALNPKMGPVRPMLGTKSWRLRAGNYRVIYDIHEYKLVVSIIKIGDRKNIYG